MSSINQVYNVNYVQSPNYKAKADGEKGVTVAVPQNDVCLNGTEALANYNKGILNNADFDLKLVEPIMIPECIDDVKGERIYNSNGELAAIIDETPKYKNVYKPGWHSALKYEYYVIDKKTGNVVKKQQQQKYTAYDEDFIDVSTVIGDQYLNTSYSNSSLEPRIISKTIKNNRFEKHVSYDTKEKMFLTYCYDKINKTKKHADYDSNKNLILSSVSETKKRDFQNVEKPKLHEKFVLDFDPKMSEGEKTYYSNGKIETNTVNENGQEVIYSFDVLGNITQIQKGNKTIFYHEDESGNLKNQSIRENLAGNKYHSTDYLADGNISYCYGDCIGKVHQYNIDPQGNIEDLFDFNSDYLNDFEEALAKRDLNLDGKISVEEVFYNDYIKHTYPHLHEKNKQDLIKQAMVDGDGSVNALEYSTWLNSEEHKKVLEEMTLLKAKNIKERRNC